MRTIDRTQLRDLSATVPPGYTDAMKLPLLTADQEIALAQRIERGDKAARESLILHNLRLVWSMALRATDRGLELDDLVQEGSIGLMRAVDRFDWRMGRRFSTYATYWIWQSTGRAIADTGRLLRLPVYVITEIGKLRRAWSDLFSTLQREPDAYETAEALAALYPGDNWTPERVAERTLDAAGVLSLDAAYTSPLHHADPSDGTLGETIADEGVMSVEDQALAAVERTEITALLSCLPTRERLIVILRFGLYDGKVWPLSAIAPVVHVTRERVRQIQELAIDRLRKLTRSDAAGYWQDDLTPARRAIVRLVSATPDARAKAWRKTATEAATALRKAV